MKEFFGVDDDYLRPAPESPLRQDIPIAAVLVVLSLSGLLAFEEMPEAPDTNLWWGSAAILLAGALISLRRLFPVTVLLLTTGVHFILFGLILPMVTVQAGMQVLYFVGLYSAIAWARRREALLYAVILVLLAMTTWIAVDLALGVAHYRAAGEDLPPMYVITQLLINIAYFTTATWLGRNSWLGARSRAELAESREVIAAQSEQLAQQAILGERLRIARELHDSVAHHVALIGVQAAAARRTMEKRPREASEALQNVESSARQTVSELRSVLGSLRDGADAPASSGLGELPALIDEVSALGLQVRYDQIDPGGQLEHLTPAVSSALYRVVQEALTNVRTHSTANEARVSLRLQPAHVEVEIVDNGHPRPGTGGMGLGQLGIRERVVALSGTAEMGPRLERGYRVLVRLPVRQREVLP